MTPALQVDHTLGHSLKASIQNFPPPLAPLQTQKNKLSITKNSELLVVKTPRPAIQWLVLLFNQVFMLSPSCFAPLTKAKTCEYGII